MRGRNPNHWTAREFLPFFRIIYLATTGLSCSVASGILIPQPGMEPKSSEFQSPSFLFYGNFNNEILMDELFLGGSSQNRKKAAFRASLVVQWLRICLPMQETWVWFRVWEDPTRHKATKCVCCRYWDPAPEPTLPNRRSRCSEKPAHRSWRKPTNGDEDPVRLEKREHLRPAVVQELHSPLNW